MHSRTAVIDRDRVAGCLLGLALGDALGAPYEGGPIERLLWRMIGRTSHGEMRWTDDTQMTLDVTESLIAQGQIDQDDLARRFAASYRWSRGYGAGAARLLRRIRRGQPWRSANRAIFANGSYGNGAAMRSAVVGFYAAHQPTEFTARVHQVAEITHAHPLALEGSLVVALAASRVALGASNEAILAALREQVQLAPFRARLEIAQQWLERGAVPSAPEIRSALGNRVTAAESCITALYLALAYRERPFLDMQQQAIAVGGDVDTIGAIAGSLWGAARGAAALPETSLARLEACSQIRAAADQLHKLLAAQYDSKGAT
ncbi:ADP-ribosylation/Crystallin J1 [Pirellula staleyi DSM 6068]|uniref:ADP-ribosylation/Crystallin J1 n=1 Tax=Pirellula staleyi (strain ATCC 27377 / DSM 6068 / ICPB 4128) TaxID=530564 RepID=D2R6B7_PIRSD|nr:ADP-ribosylglycohydrolase family protein [Pirellula staleyi]ADB15495.1 ADP-ribosylation/Crystallin J1 [Pirellula staleyi DSM 6068]